MAQGNDRGFVYQEIADIVAVSKISAIIVNFHLNGLVRFAIMDFKKSQTLTTTNY